MDRRRGEKELLVLKPYLGDYRQRFHVRQIAEMLRMNHRTVSLALQRLEKQGVVSYAMEGRNKRYFLVLDKPLAKDVLVSAETEQKLALFRKHFVLEKLFAELGPEMKDSLVAVFGSYAKGEETKGSDIDIALIGSGRQLVNKIKEFSGRHNKTMHVQSLTRKSFEEGLKRKDALITEIIKNHVVINSAQLFVDIMWRHFNETG